MFISLLLQGSLFHMLIILFFTVQNTFEVIFMAKKGMYRADNIYDKNKKQSRDCTRIAGRS